MLHHDQGKIISVFENVSLRLTGKRIKEKGHKYTQDALIFFSHHIDVGNTR